MKQEFKTIAVSVDLDVILRKYAEDFKAHDCFEIINRYWFVDMHQNKVCFVIRTVKEEE